MDLLLVSVDVLAADADAVLGAHLPLRETLAVEFQAVDFGALAALPRVPRVSRVTVVVRLLSRREVELAYQADRRGVVTSMLLLHDGTLIEKFLEQVLVLEIADKPGLDGFGT